MSSMKEKCDKCGNNVSRALYEKNSGLCAKCARRTYPDWADDPREDVRTCSYMGFENSWGLRPVSFPSYNMRGTKCDG